MILRPAAPPRALDLEFRFVWPRGHDPCLDEPGQLFGERFLRSFEITDLDSRVWFETNIDNYGEIWIDGKIDHTRRATPISDRR
jgi:hypothetical protein